MYLHATILCSYMCERQFGHASNQYTHHTKKHPHTQLLGGAVVRWWCVVLYPDAYIYTSLESHNRMQDGVVGGVV